MGYYDEEDDEYYGYHENIEPVELISEAFTERNITEVLESAGLVSERTPKYTGNMEKLVFLYGDDNEVYSASEIRFIEKVNSVFMYSEYNKTIKQNKMVCRVIAAKIEENGSEAVSSCVAFEKIANKALDGFNTFLFVAEDSVFFGCRIFDKLGKYDCALSNPIKEENQFEEILEEFAYTADRDDFLDYYRQIRGIITANQYEVPNLEDLMTRRKGIRQSYLDNLDAIGESLGVNFSKEKERYNSIFDEIPEESFVELLDSVCDSLSFIKSNRINAYEMLFEADEMMRQAEQVEADNDKLVEKNLEKDNHDEETDSEAKALLDNPEEMIKLLKKRRGI